MTLLEDIDIIRLLDRARRLQNVRISTIARDLGMNRRHVGSILSGKSPCSLRNAGLIAAHLGYRLCLVQVELP